jgi:hypothetical protein
MLQLKEQSAMVFEAKESEKIKNTVTANLSTSRKVKNEDGEKYEYMSWNARFVGNAFEKAKELKDKDVITIKEAAIENRYDKENTKLYVNVIVFDFEMKE